LPLFIQIEKTKTTTTTTTTKTCHKKKKKGILDNQKFSNILSLREIFQRACFCFDLFDPHDPKDRDPYPYPGFMLNASRPQPPPPTLPPLPTPAHLLSTPDDV
jgi:hypothetical protein